MQEENNKANPETLQGLRELGQIIIGQKFTDSEINTIIGVAWLMKKHYPLFENLVDSLEYESKELPNLN